VYYVWTAQIRYWRRWVVQLDLDWSDGLPPFTNTCESLRDRLPPTLRYRFVPRRAPFLDQMWSASRFDVYSPGARTLLREFGVGYEEVPAELRDSTGRILTSEYRFVHVTTCVKAVDWESSDVEVGSNWRGERTVRHVRHFVLQQDAIPANVPVFRLDEANTVILASEEFRNEWERRGLTGAHFRSLDHYPKP
jgi:hypothetical protein